MQFGNMSVMETFENNPFYETVKAHFNEPVITALEVGRLVGYAEDESCDYYIIYYPSGIGTPVKKVWLSCVGGLIFLTPLQGQGVAGAWDDYKRIDEWLTLNGAPKRETILLEQQSIHPEGCECLNALA